MEIVIRILYKFNFRKLNEQTGFLKEREMNSKWGFPFCDEVISRDMWSIWQDAENAM